MNIFDAIGKTVFDISRAAFGYSAKWLPSVGPEVVAKVLYQYPTYKVDMDENNFTLEKFFFEYYETDFPGLYESVSDAGNESVQVEVTTAVWKSFIVKRCEKKGDGKTIVAFISPVDL
jgi:hypothetical protein